MTAPVRLALAAALAVSLAGCLSRRDPDEPPSRRVSSGLGGEPGEFRASQDTYGTGRRLDVFGPQNAPVLPTMGMPGFGK